MVSQLRDDGLLALSWGSALNRPHCLTTATDGAFHALAAGKVTRLLEGLGVYVHYLTYEAAFISPGRVVRRGAGLGTVCALAFRDSTRARGPRSVCELLDVDQA